ncbi:MAG: PQQ-dependent sugar dehydrogenase, partial [Melioribacteraceae bacterium]|nr:PQQ-dependent sugar dehydrogenase [Melioribacteraceae bacterium]
GGEQGLLGLAFHPNFVTNGYFYVNYTTNNPRRTVISRFSVSDSDSDKADKNSELILMEINQPFSNHNGGQIVFGPDGYLYISTGDGGSGGDPQNHAQNLSSLLGKILRIDVDNSDNGLNYSIPDSNPFKDNDLNQPEEIYAYGLRNVWKFSFDSQERLWAADVGQNAREEINLIENGGNYGWRKMEGFLCYNPSNCDPTGLELPVWDYAHNSQGGYSITGGYVYEGDLMPGLKGKYIYGDFITGNFWAFDPDDSTNVFINNFPVNVSTFGIDQQNELYMADYDLGVLYRFSDDQISSVESLVVNKMQLQQNYPNPFNPSTTIKYRIPASMNSEKARVKNVSLKVYDILGRDIATLVNQAQRPGNYEVVFSAKGEETYSVGRRLPSGIYFYKLQVGDYLEVKKMMLVK